jgi:hypothetical protein
MFARLKAVMQTLVYPSFLGTFIVGFVQELETHGQTPTSTQVLSQQEISLGLLMLIYFGSLFVETEATEGQSYSVWTFAVDVVEVSLMFVAFRCLGYLGDRILDVRWYYGMLGTVFLCPIFWRLFVERRFKDFLTCLSIIAFCLAAVGLVLGRHDDRLTNALWILLAVYIVDIVVVRAFFYSRRQKTRCLVTGKYRLVQEIQEPNKCVAGDPMPDASTQPVTDRWWQLVEMDATWGPLSWKDTKNHGTALWDGTKARVAAAWQKVMNGDGDRRGNENKTD